MVSVKLFCSIRENLISLFFMKINELEPVLYVAFLRGINVGGNKLVKMEDLIKIFTVLGFENVQTVLASGNVVFQSAPVATKKLVLSIETALKKKLGHSISVMVRLIKNLKKLSYTKPFDAISVTRETRRYVTFISEKPKNTLKLPYVSPEKDFSILSATPTEVFSVLTLSKKRSTVDVMSIVEKEYGKNSTTRNWNTIERILNNVSILKR